MRFLSFGEILLRLSPPGAAGLLQALPGTLEAGFGGSEANTAVALAALGAPSSFLTLLPQGPLGDACLASLTGRGVKVDQVVRTDRGRLGIYFLEKGAGPRPSRVVYDREGSALALASPGDLEWNSALEEAQWLHLSGITPALSRGAAELTREGAEKARAAGIPYSIDLNYRARLWRWEEGTGPEALARSVLPPIARGAALVAGNEEDALRIFGLTVKGLDLSRGRLDPAAYAGLAEETAARCPGARFVAFSLRRSLDASRNLWGGMLFDVETGKAHYHPRDEEGNFAPLEIAPMVDRVGAGDAFTAGLLFGLFHERTLPARALALAVAAGALAHTYPGDWLLSGLEEVDALARGETSGRIRR